MLRTTCPFIEQESLPDCVTQAGNLHYLSVTRPACRQAGFESSASTSLSADKGRFRHLGKQGCNITEYVWFSQKNEPFLFTGYKQPQR